MYGIMDGPQGCDRGGRRSRGGRGGNGGDGHDVHGAGLDESFTQRAEIAKDGPFRLVKEIGEGDASSSLSPQLSSPRFTPLSSPCSHQLSSPRSPVRGVLPLRNRNLSSDGGDRTGAGAGTERIQVRRRGRRGTEHVNGVCTLYDHIRV